MNTKNLFLLLVGLSMSFYSIGQCEEVNASIWKDTWRSCEASQNPNDLHGLSHWILYDLGMVQRLSKAHIWNTNEAGLTEAGFKKVVVEYSKTGRRWTALGTYVFPQGTGEAVYEGFEGFDFKGEDVRFVLITALENWGHPSCFGLAEVKFNLTTPGSLDEVITATENPSTPSLEFELTPNPAQGAVQLQIGSGKTEQVMVRITNLNGQTLYQQPNQLFNGQNRIQLPLTGLIAGVYFVSVYREKGGQVRTKKLVVLEE